MNAAVRVAGVVALAGILAGAVGCSRQAKVERLLAKGERSLDQGDLGAAMAAGFEAYQLSGKTNSQAIGLLGGVFLEQGDLGKAFPLLAQAVQMRSNDATLQFRFGKAALGVRNPGAAIASFKQALSLQPTNGQAYILLSEAAQQLPEDDRQRSEVRMWLDGRPALAQQVAGYQAALGNMALLSGNTNEARGRFERAVALDSKEPSAYLGMAELGRLAGDATRARALFKQAVDLSPVRSGARLRYTAFLLTEPGQLEEARNQLARILSGAPDFLPALMLKARLELSNRQWDDCAGTLERIERQMGANYDTALLRGQVLIGQASAADSAVGRQRLDEAVALLTKLAEAHTNSFEALYFKAVAEAGRGDGENAVRDLAKSLGLLSTNALSKPQSIQAVLLLAELEAQQGNAERASMLVTKYLAEMGPQAPAAALQTVGMQLARLQVLAGRYADAISRYQSLAQQNPKDPRFPLLMGGVFLMQSEQAERKKDTAEATRLRQKARSEFERSLVVQPGYLGALAALVAMDEEAGKFAQAEAMLQKALQAEPNSPQLAALLADLYLNAARTAAAGKTDQERQVMGLGRDALLAKAEQTVQRALELSADSRAALLLLARIQVETGRQKEALERLDAVLAKNPRDDRTLLQKAMLLSELKDYAAARDAYERLIAAQAQPSAEALNNLAYLYSEHLQDLDKALKHGSAAEAAAPRNPYVADTVGWIYFRRGQYEEALRRLSRSVQSLEAAAVGAEMLTKDPVNPEIRYHLGMTYYMRGEEELAKAQLTKAAAGLGKDQPGKADVEARLKVLAMDPKNINASQLTELEGLAGKWPDDPGIMLRLAVGYEQSANPAKAADRYAALRRANPGDVAAGLRLARLYARDLNQPEKAIEVLNEMRRQSGDDAQVAWYLGRLTFQRGDYAYAAELLEEAARKLGMNGELSVDLALASYAVGREARAEEAMNRALSSNPAIPSARAEEARRFLQCVSLSRDPKAAAQSLSALQGILKVDPGYVPALFAAAVAEDQNNRIDASRDYYLAALKRYPKFLPAARNLALLLALRKNDLAAAAPMAEQIREVYASDPQVKRLLGMVEYQKQRFPQAIQLLQASLDSSPNDPATLCYLGLAQAAAGQKAQAIPNLKKGIEAKPDAPWAAAARKAVEELQKK